MDEAALHELLYGARPGAGLPAYRRREPDFAILADDLRRHDYLTLQTVWQEYCEAEPGGCSYSRFCKLYRSWLGRRDLTLRHEYRAGERMDVDYARPTVRVEDPRAAYGPEVLSGSRRWYRSEFRSSRTARSKAWAVAARSV